MIDSLKRLCMACGKLASAAVDSEMTNVSNKLDECSESIEKLADEISEPKKDNSKQLEFDL